MSHRRANGGPTLIAAADLLESPLLASDIQVIAHSPETPQHHQKVTIGKFKADSPVFEVVRSLLGESSRNTIEPRAIADARSRGINDQATKSADTRIGLQDPHDSSWSSLLMNDHSRAENRTKSVELDDTYTLRPVLGPTMVVHQ
jgi:hypothetical protein